MNTDDLRVDFDGLNGDTIPKLIACEEQLQEVYGKMKSVVSSLDQYMEAESAQSYATEFTVLVGPSIESMENLIKEYYTQLKQVAARFAEVDSSLARKISI